MQAVALTMIVRTQTLESSKSKPYRIAFRRNLGRAIAVTPVTNSVPSARMGAIADTVLPASDASAEPVPTRAAGTIEPSGFVVVFVTVVVLVVVTVCVDVTVVVEVRVVVEV